MDHDLVPVRRAILEIHAGDLVTYIKCSLEPSEGKPDSLELFKNYCFVFGFFCWYTTCKQQHLRQLREISLVRNLQDYKFLHSEADNRDQTQQNTPKTFCGWRCVLLNRDMVFVCYFQVELTELLKSYCFVFRFFYWYTTCEQQHLLQLREISLVRKLQDYKFLHSEAGNRDQTQQNSPKNFCGWRCVLLNRDMVLVCCFQAELTEIQTQLSHVYDSKLMFFYLEWFHLLLTIYLPATHPIHQELVGCRAVVFLFCFCFCFWSV